MVQFIERFQVSLDSIPFIMILFRLLVRLGLMFRKINRKTKLQSIPYFGVLHIP